MGNPMCRNVQLAHSNIQVGEVVPNYTDTTGRMWKSEVDMEFVERWVGRLKRHKKEYTDG